MTASPIKEDFLHYLWRAKKIPPHHYVTTDGRSLEILDFGIYNTDAGPDFFNAKIKVDNTIWAGNIEMHVFSSDWKKHKHQHDKAYENVILHVVYENDHPIRQSENEPTPIPTLELKGKIPRIYLENYLTLVQSTLDIPCSTLIRAVDKDKIALWKYTLTVDRIHQKATAAEEIYRSAGNDWEETLYIMLARYFGSKVNTEPFERLARSLPLSIINKNKDKKETLEALLYGQAGMLMAHYQDEYFTSLKKEYIYQQKKYNLTPTDPVAWKFSRLRPMNFPTVRIAQFAGLLYRVTFLFSQVKEAETPAEIRKMLVSGVSEYWIDHYRFEVPAVPVLKNTGQDFIDSLMINAISPVLYLYGKMNDDERYIQKAISILEHTAGEQNQITELWKSVGIPTGSAFDSQALIHLKNQYCNEFRCMACKIGNEIMNLK
ncbi:MAG: DUF2851 family protein [Saprospiraceae bacterium]|nr:DUF2851 family protein [Saprospiraceae bacterium]